MDGQRLPTWERKAIATALGRSERGLFRNTEVNEARNRELGGPNETAA